MEGGEGGGKGGKGEGGGSLFPLKICLSSLVPEITSKLALLFPKIFCLWRFPCSPVQINPHMFPYFAKPWEGHTFALVASFMCSMLQK